MPKGHYPSMQGYLPALLTLKLDVGACAGEDHSDACSALEHSCANNPVTHVLAHRANGEQLQDLRHVEVLTRIGADCDY